MQCPACKKKDTKVIDTREVDEGSIIRRRRECLSCGFRFSTYEHVEVLNLQVIKKSGRKEPYAREKLEAGIRKALEKRPVTEEQVQKLLSQIEREIQEISREEVTSHDIGERVMEYLKKIDEVAYIRFASVYKSFSDIESFQKEIKRLSKKLET